MLPRGVVLVGQIRKTESTSSREVGVLLEGGRKERWARELPSSECTLEGWEAHPTVPELLADLPVLP